jgi:hypothetical protein
MIVSGPRVTRETWLWFGLFVAIAAGILITFT